MPVDRGELRRIADAAEVARRSEEAQRRRDRREEASAQRKKIAEAAEKILGSVPDALKKAAASARRTSSKGGRVVVAHIPIVEERFSSIMQSAGDLDAEDEGILRAVRRNIKGLRIPGVELKIRSETREGGYQSADGDDTVYGPCKDYYIEARTDID